MNQGGRFCEPENEKGDHDNREKGRRITVGRGLRRAVDHGGLLLCRRRSTAGHVATFAFSPPQTDQPSCQRPSRGDLVQVGLG